MYNSKPNNMAQIADTPAPPYYAVIFTTIRTAIDDGYEHMAERMLSLAAQQVGFLGVESARTELGITISYWTDLTAIRNWKLNAEHLLAQELGREKWYQNYKTRICKVERDYDFSSIGT